MDNQGQTEREVESTSKQDSGSKIALDWKNFDAMMMGLMKTMPKYDTIVGIANGGMVPASFLANMLDCRLAFMYMRHYEGMEKQDEVKFGGFFGRVEGKVLLVDDVADTGETFLKAKEMYPHFDTLALYVKPGSKFEPSFTWCRVDKWIVFPWERESRRSDEEK